MEPKHALRLGLALAFMAMGAQPGQAADAAADLQAGSLTVHNVCVRCHQVDPQPITGDPAPGTPPPFIWIAKRHPDEIESVSRRPLHRMSGVTVTPAEMTGLRAWFDMLSRAPE